MLSIENSSPADPNENSLEGVDLSNPPSLDDHNLVPNFCIRDYVFNNRRKDIATNWPFSQKSLQLCMKHGVKDLLPPFECLDCVRNQSIEKDFVESNFGEKGKLQILDVDPCNSSNVQVNSSPNDVGNISFSELESDKQLPLTANTPQEVFSKTFEKSEPHFLKKPDIPKSPSMKKCKLIVKVGSNGAEQNSNSNTASIVKPIAASKVCPVCKTFSSSSNTKLNAHIDQCLFVDSPIEPSSKSRVIKHRIKLRKTRLMVDIYATALHCTLEELDRRNGRIWNEKPTLSPIQEIAVDIDKEKKKNGSFKEKSDDDEVYIDTNGTKLRILNKITGTSLVSKLGVSSSKAFKEGKGTKWLSTYKKKKKHHKYLKLASQREKQCSYKTRLASRVLGDQEKDLPVKDNPKTDAIECTNMTPSFKAQKQMKALDTGTIMPKWVSSKRTNLLKRRSEIDHSSLDDSHLERSCSEKVHICYESPNLSPKKGKEMSTFSSGDRVSECHEQPLKKKQMKFKSFKAQSSTKITKFSSSKEQMLSVDQSSLSNPKFSKKGTFRVKNVEIRDDRVKNLEHQHRINEGSGIAQLPLKRSNLLKTKERKSSSTATISRRNESTEDGFLNVEQPHGGKSVIGPSSGADCENIMSLAKSFDQDLDTVVDSNMRLEICPTNEQINYFSGVDPITIPSPPGSFLPSPGRTSSDEDMVDRDSSNSPKSAISTVSKTLETNSDPKMAENMSFEPCIRQDEMINLGFSDEITKSNLRFQGDQPCCCSRKEGIFVNSQESQILRRRVMENPSSFYQSERANDMINHGNSSVYPVSQSDLGSISVKVDVKQPIYGDYGSPSPSSPNPVLRLMGKNLMVVNNDENSNQSPNSKFQMGPQDRVVRQVSPFYGYRAIDLDLPIDLNRSRNNQFSCFSDMIQRNEESIIPKDRRDVIVIDDSPENEIPTRSGGVSSPMANYYNLNPFYSNQGYDFSQYRGPHVKPNVSSQMPAPPSLGSMRWNNVLEGSRIPPPSPLSPYRRF